MKKLLNGASLVALSILVAACGGGTTSQTPIVPNDTPPPAPPPPPDPDPTPIDPATFRTTEFNANYGIGALRAEYAYAEGLTGEGVTLGFVDFNFGFNSPEIDFHPDSIGPDADNVAIYEAQIDGEAPTDPHGQWVVGVAAGARNDLLTHGVAYDAEVLAVDFFSGVNERTFTDGGVLVHESNPYTFLTDRGVRIVSISIGFDETDIITNPPVVSEVYVVANPAFVIQEGGLLISSAGNNFDGAGNGLEPQLSNLQIIEDAQVNGLFDGDGAFIIAGGVDENNEIAFFSDRAGDDPDVNSRYLVAPAVDIAIPNGNALALFNGTSFSSPHIAGAAAILMQNWPQLSSREIADILFDTATDLGAPGTDNVYGRGLVNLEEAIKPQGQTQVAVANASTSGSTELTSTSLSLGGAFGAAPSAAFSDVLILDDYGRDYYVDLGQSVSATSLLDTPTENFLFRGTNWDAAGARLGRQTSIALYVAQDPIHEDTLAAFSEAAQALRPKEQIAVEFTGSLDRTTDWRAGHGLGLTNAMGGQSAAASQGLSFVREDASSNAAFSANGTHAIVTRQVGKTWDLSFGIELGETPGTNFSSLEESRGDLPRTAAAVQVDHYFKGGAVSARVGMLHEQGTVLGTRATGALSLADDAVTTYSSISSIVDLASKLSLSAELTAASTDVTAPAGSLFSDAQRFTSTAWAVSLNARDVGLKGVSAGLRVSQPLRIENANVTLLRATHIDLDTRSPVFAAESLSLAPNGREIAVEAGLGVIQADWRFEANLFNRFDAGHVAGLNDAGMVLRLSNRF